MNDLTKTAVFVGVALALLAGAAAATWTPDRGSPGAAFEKFEQGKPFFPEFNDPLAASSLEVSEFDDTTATIRPFKVEVKDGKWSIPSHYDYPADGKERLSKTASGVIDLKKDTVRSISAEDHEALGVVDPLDTKATSIKGRGKRVTLKDKTGKVLADFIIGKPIKDRPGQRYVRVPDQKVTYGVTVDVDLSTKFADWIETNLLKLDAARIRSITFDSTKVDPERGQILPGETVTITRKDASAPWTMTDLAEDQEVSSDKLTELTAALTDLKIVGVRPKPAGLTQDLSLGKDISLTQQAILSLAGKGFYLTKDGRLLSNQGDVRVATDEGVVYTLRFGEATFATGDALTAGGEDESTQSEAKTKDEDDAKKEEEKDAAGGSRYLMVTVSFDDSAIARPEGMAGDEPSELPADVFQRTEEEQKAEEARLAREKEDYEKRIAEGKEKVGELADRFAGWYYLTPDSSFKKIALDRAALTRKKGEQPPAGPGGAGANPFGGGGLPPGFPGGNFPMPAGHP